MTRGDEVLRILLAGNTRSVDARLSHPRQSQERRREVPAGQHPCAIILGCSDSPVPLEIIVNVMPEGYSPSLSLTAFA